MIKITDIEWDGKDVEVYDEKGEPFSYREFRVGTPTYLFLVKLTNVFRESGVAPFSTKKEG